MEKNKLTLWNLPNKIVLVDDEPSFLNSLNTDLAAQMLTKIFYNPMKALDYILSESSQNNFDSDYIDDETELVDVHLDLRQVYKKIYDPNRFSEIATVVLDFSMPGLDGFELAKKIIDHNYRIILLTGEAGIDKAIEAFNENIIHNYIPKYTEDLSDVLKSRITQQQNLYFHTKTKFYLQNMDQENFRDIFNILQDPAWIENFNNICKQNNIIEYYLLSPEGDYLLADAKGNLKILILKTQATLDGYVQTAAAAPDARKITEQLAAANQIPFFFSDADFQTEPKDWQSYLHPAKKLTGDLDTYYYALIEPGDQYDFAADSILSYQDYLQRG